MTSARTLRWAIGAAIAAFLAACASQLSTQEVSIGASDLGGVVTEPQRTGSRRLGDRRDHRPADQVREDGGHRRARALRRSRAAESDLQRLGARLRAGRFAQGARRAGQARSISPRCRRRTRPRPRSTTRRSTGTRCSRFRRRSDFGGSTRIPKERTQADWLKQMKNIGCIGCHQLGQASTRTIPAAFAHVELVGRGVDAPPAVRPVRRADDQPARRQFRRRCRTSTTASGPIASPRASCRSPSRSGRRASSATSSSPPGSGAPRSTICTT